MQETLWAPSGSIISARKLCASKYRTFFSKNERRNVFAVLCTTIGTCMAYLGGTTTGRILASDPAALIDVELGNDNIIDHRGRGSR
jgi:hypothetical protein